MVLTTSTSFFWRPLTSSTSLASLSAYWLCFEEDAAQVLPVLPPGPGVDVGNTLRNALDLAHQVLTLTRLQLCGPEEFLARDLTVEQGFDGALHH